MCSLYADAPSPATDAPAPAGPPAPPPSDDIHLFWHHWITRGWFDWESEGLSLLGQSPSHQDLLAIPDRRQRPVCALQRFAGLAERRNRHHRPVSGYRLCRPDHFKGTNGRWQAVLSPELQQLYTEAAARVLDAPVKPGTTRWRVVLI